MAAESSIVTSRYFRCGQLASVWRGRRGCVCSPPARCSRHLRWPDDGVRPSGPSMGAGNRLHRGL